jgi:hypothetical protein
MLPIGDFSPAYRQNLHFAISACRHGRRHGHRRESHAREVDLTALPARPG